MSEQKRLDRPGREKIAEILFNMVAQHRHDYKLSPMRTNWDEAKEVVKELYGKWAGQILALFPDIEEALKQRDKQWGEEVKRLFDKGYQKCLDDNLGFAEEAKKPLLKEIDDLRGIINELSNK